MRKLIASAAVLGAAAGSILTAPSAHAAGPAEKCLSYTSSGSSVTSCVRITWARQADGDGVRLESIGGTTPNGCQALEDAGRYDPVRPFWVDTSSGRVDYQYEFGEEPCTFTKDVSNAGSDTGAMDFRYAARARIDLAPDKMVYMGWTLRADGTSTLNYAFTADV